MTRNNPPSSSPATVSAAATRWQAFALLRAGLWNTPVDATLFNGDTDWDAITTFATRQTVAGLVAEAIGTLPAACQPTAPVMHKLRSMVSSTLRGHALLNRTLVEVMELLRQNDIPAVLLKGQGVAMNYAVPTLRQCGDIDLYVGHQHYSRACALATTWGVEQGSSSESEKHYHFHHAGVTVELHRIAERLPLPWRDARFQRWTEKNLQGNCLRTVTIGGSQIQVPPVNFDALYIFNHAWHHFAAGGGIGLRQLCDWVRCLHTFRHEIDRNELRCHLRNFGLWRPWQLFGCIAVDELGLPAEEFPFYTRRYARQAIRMMDIIEEGGNFGFFHSIHTHRPDGYVAGKMHTFRKMHRHFGKLALTCPTEMWPVWGRYLFVGIRQVIIDQLQIKNRRCRSKRT